MKRYLIIILLSILLMIGQWGCAHAPSYKPPSLSDQIKAKLGTIGVVSAQFQPKGTFRMPMGKKDATSAGAKKGFEIATEDPDPRSWIILPITIPICVGGGAIIGSMLGVSDSKKEKAEAVLNSAISELKIEERMQQHVLKIAQEKTIYPFVSIEEDFQPSFSDEVRLTNCLQERRSGINTVLKIIVSSCGLHEKEKKTQLHAFSRNTAKINPPLSFSVIVTIRIIRVEDCKEFYYSQFRYESKGKFRFIKWAANNAQLFREEIDRGCQSLAEKIVRELFLTPES